MRYSLLNEQYYDFKKLLEIQEDDMIEKETYIGESIRKLRKAKGLTRDCLAEEIGISV